VRERILERVDSLFNTTDRLETSPSNPYSKLPDTFLVYVAGLIDGEGCIFIHSSPNAKGERRQYDMGVTISNTSQELLSHLKLYLDGYTDKTTAHSKQVYCLRFNSGNAAISKEAKRAESTSR